MEPNRVSLASGITYFGAVYSHMPGQRLQMTLKKYRARFVTARGLGASGSKTALPTFGLRAFARAPKVESNTATQHSLSSSRLNARSFDLLPLTTNTLRTRASRDLDIPHMTASLAKL